MSVTIDGTNLIDLGIRVETDSDIPGTPPTRDKTLTIPDRHGAYDFGAYLGPMDFSLDCSVITSDNREIQRIIDQVKRLLFDERGRPKDVKLVYPYEPDKHYNVRFRGQMSALRAFYKGEFDLPFTAFDPFLYSNVSNDEVLWGSQIITFEYDYVFGHTGGNVMTITSPQTVLVTVNGDLLRPIIRIDGSGNNVGFSVNGKSFNLENFSNTSWEINGHNYTVLKNGESSFGEFDGDFLELINGQNEIQISGSSLNFDLQISFRDKYI